MIALWINDIGRMPRWTEVGGLVEYCGIKHVGSGICDVYKTGTLFLFYSGVGNAGAPGAGAPVKFYWSEVEDHHVYARQRGSCVV